MSFTFSKVDFPEKGQCTQFATDYCFALSFKLPDSIVESVIDKPSGISDQVLQTIQSGFIDVGDWNGANMYRNPEATLSWGYSRWNLTLNNGVILLQSGPGIEQSVLTTPAWWVRIITDPNTIEEKTQWMEIPSPFSEGSPNCSRAHTFPQYEMGYADFPGPEMFVGAKNVSCSERGFEKEIGRGRNHGTFVKFYGGSRTKNSSEDATRDVLVKIVDDSDRELVFSKDNNVVKNEITSRESHNKDFDEICFYAVLGAAFLAILVVILKSRKETEKSR